MGMADAEAPYRPHTVTPLRLLAALKRIPVAILIFDLCSHPCSNPQSKALRGAPSGRRAQASASACDFARSASEKRSSHSSRGAIPETL